MRDVAKAVGALLDGQTGLSWYDGEVAADAPGRYVVFYLTTPRGEGERIAGDQPVRAYLLSTMYVGATPNECRWVAEKVHAALSNMRPAIASHMATPIRLGTAGQVRRDDSINPPAWIATDVWRFSTTPA